MQHDYVHCLPCLQFHADDFDLAPGLYRDLLMKHLLHRGTLFYFMGDAPRQCLCSEQ